VTGGGASIGGVSSGSPRRRSVGDVHSALTAGVQTSTAGTQMRDAAGNLAGTVATHDATGRTPRRRSVGDITREQIPPGGVTGGEAAIGGVSSPRRRSVGDIPIALTPTAETRGAQCRRYSETRPWPLVGRCRLTLSNPCRKRLELSA
jgi:hypothetical protein